MWKDFFYFTKSEQRGIVVLIVLISIVFFFNIFQSHFYTSPSLNESQIELINKVQMINDSLEAESRDTLFFFDPNLVSEREMKLLGLTSFQRKALIGYREKVGRIDNADDLSLVYGFDTLTIKRLSDYVRISKPVRVKSKVDSVDKIQWVNFNKVSRTDLSAMGMSKECVDSILLLRSVLYITKSLPYEKVISYSEKELLSWVNNKSKNRFEVNKGNLNAENYKVELNGATYEELVRLTGIGDVLANRIIKFRDLLGGFYRKEQILEVYNLKEETYVAIKDHLFVDESKVIQLNFDTLSIKEISRHPYISFDQSKQLYNLFRKNKTIDENEAMKLSSINKEQWMRIKPYLFIN